MWEDEQWIYFIGKHPHVLVYIYIYIYIYHHFPMNHIQCHSPSTMSCHHSLSIDNHHRLSLTFGHHCLCLTQATIIHPLPLIHNHRPWISLFIFCLNLHKIISTILLQNWLVILLLKFFLDDVYNNGGQVGFVWFFCLTLVMTIMVWAPFRKHDGSRGSI